MMVNIFIISDCIIILLTVLSILYLMLARHVEKILLENGCRLLL